MLHLVHELFEMNQCCCSLQRWVQILCQSSHVSAIFSSQSTLSTIPTRSPLPPATTGSTTWAHREGNQTTTGQQLRYRRTSNVGTASLFIRTTVEDGSAVAYLSRAWTCCCRTLCKICVIEVLRWIMINYDLKCQSTSSPNKNKNTNSEFELIRLLSRVLPLEWWDVSSILSLNEGRATLSSYEA